jgi:hypothetical protein
MTRDRMAAEDFLLTHQTQVSKLEFDRLVGATSLAPRTNKKQMHRFQKSGSPWTTSFWRRFRVAISLA